MTADMQKQYWICWVINHWSNIVHEQISFGGMYFTTEPENAWHCWNIWDELSAQHWGRERQRETRRIFHQNVRLSNWTLSFILLFWAFLKSHCSMLSLSWWKCNEVWCNSANFSRNACGSAFQPNTNNTADKRCRWKLTEDLKSFLTQTHAPCASHNLIH